MKNEKFKLNLKWIGIFFLGCIAWVFGKGLLSPILSNYIAKALSLGNYIFLIHSILSTIFVVILIYIIYSKITVCDFNAFGLKKELILKESGIGIIVGLIFAAISIFIIIPLAGEDNKAIIEATKLVNKLPLINIIGAGILLGGIAEELFFRAHIITSVTNIKKNNKYLQFIAVIISATLFGLGHGYQGTLGIIFTSVTSVIYALMFLKRNSIISPIVAHALYDTVVALAIKYFISF